jgi:hypothetical protein
MIQPVDIFIGHMMVERCEKWGYRMVDIYNSDKRKRGRSLQVSNTRNLPTQAMSKMAEVAVCLYMDMDPITSINWGFLPDNGLDLRLTNGLTVDAKSSNNSYARRLIWPRSSAAKVHQAADVLVWSRVLPAHRTKLGQIVNLVGWIKRDRFIKQMIKAHNENNISDGTLYVWETALDNMDRLRDIKQSLTQRS